MKTKSANSSKTCAHVEAQEEGTVFPLPRPPARDGGVSNRGFNVGRNSATGCTPAMERTFQRGAARSRCYLFLVFVFFFVFFFMQWVRRDPSMWQKRRCAECGGDACESGDASESSSPWAASNMLHLLQSAGWMNATDGDRVAVLNGRLDFSQLDAAKGEGQRVLKTLTLS